jgi:hypothetical protein
MCPTLKLGPQQLTFCIAAMQKPCLQFRRPGKILTPSPERVPPPISAHECSPLEVQPFIGASNKLSRVDFDPAFLLRQFQAAVHVTVTCWRSIGLVGEPAGQLGHVVEGRLEGATPAVAERSSTIRSPISACGIIASTTSQPGQPGRAS